MLKIDLSNEPRGTYISVVQIRTDQTGRGVRVALGCLSCLIVKLHSSAAISVFYYPLNGRDSITVTYRTRAASGSVFGLQVQGHSESILNAKVDKSTSQLDSSRCSALPFQAGFHQLT